MSAADESDALLDGCSEATTLIHDFSSPADQASGTFRHVALMYAGERAFVDAISAFIRDGVSAGEPALVVVSARKIELLRSELGDAADRVCFADMLEVGQNPAAIISAWDDFVRDRFAEGQRVRGVGEPIWAGRTPDELEECHHHEALLNLAFADAPGFWLVCPYDTESLDPEVIEHASRTHPFVSEDGVERPSPVYSGDLCGQAFDGELEPAPDDAYEVAFDEDSLAAMRAFVGELAEDAGIDATRRDDLLLAVNELATNSIRHGGGDGVLRAWTEHRALVCEVCDTGHIAEPLTGRLRPPAGGLSGYGLWLVNQVCDLVQVRANSTGNVVRMRVRS
jgi:anti-sigma regulatory factor (Ser/Thr protein kinase)